MLWNRNQSKWWSAASNLSGVSDFLAMVKQNMSAVVWQGILLGTPLESIKNIDIGSLSCSYSKWTILTKLLRAKLQSCFEPNSLKQNRLSRTTNCDYWILPSSKWQGRYIRSCGGRHIIPPNSASIQHPTEAVSDDAVAEYRKADVTSPCAQATKVMNCSNLLTLGSASGNTSTLSWLHSHQLRFSQGIFRQFLSWVFLFNVLFINCVFFFYILFIRNYNDLNIKTLICSLFATCT